MYKFILKASCSALNITAIVLVLSLTVKPLEDKLVNKNSQLTVDSKFRAQHTLAGRSRNTKTSLYLMNIFMKWKRDMVLNIKWSGEKEWS